jgi:hypothetical protein
MPIKKKNLNKKNTKTKKHFFYGGAGKINLGSMQPIIKSLLIKNRNLSYYLEYINFKLIKENESSDDKIKASDVEAVLQTFSLAINVIEAKSEELRNNPPPPQVVKHEDVVNYDSENEEGFGDLPDCKDGFCVLPEEREQVTRLAFNDIKELLENYIRERTKKINEKLTDEENNKKYTTILKNLVTNLFNTVLQNKETISKELVSSIAVASEVTPLTSAALSVAQPVNTSEVVETVNIVQLTEVEGSVLNDFKNFNTNLAEDTRQLTFNLRTKIQDLLGKIHHGVHTKTLLDLSSMLIDHVGTYIEVFVTNNVHDYKSFIETIFLNVNNNSSIFNAVLNCNSMIQNYATKIILNKEVVEMLIKSLGTGFDILNLYSIISFANLTLSGDLINSIINPSTGAKAAAGIVNVFGDTLAADFTKVYNDDTNLKKEGFLFLANQLMKVTDPVRFAKTKINSIINSVTGILYTNDEMVKSLNEKRESGEQLLNVVLSWNKTITETAFKGISFTNGSDKLWNKLEASTILRQFNPNTEEIIINTNLTKIYADYDNIIKDVNSVICKLRCVETFLPISSTSMFTFIPDENFLNFKEEQIALLLQYVIQKIEFTAVKNTVKTLTELTNLVQDEISKESSMKEFIKIKIYEVANIDDDCNEKRVVDSPPGENTDAFWSWENIKKTVQDVAEFAIEGTIEGRTPQHILELDEAKFKDLNLFSNQKGGTIIDKKNKELFYNNLATIIYCDWRMTNLVSKQQLDSAETDILHSCIDERLAAYRILKKMGLMDVTCFESVLRKLSNTLIKPKDEKTVVKNEYVVQSINNEYEKLQNQTINEDNFLLSVLDLLCTQRVKLCVELFSKYYDTDAYKTYKRENEPQFIEMWSTYKSKVQQNPLQNTYLTYGWKSCQFALNVLSKIHDLKSSASEKFKQFFFTSGGGTRKRRRTRTKKIRRRRTRTSTKRTKKRN